MREEQEVVIGFRGNAELKQALRECAKADDRSISSFIRLALEDRLRAKGYLPAPAKPLQEQSRRPRK